MKLRAVCSTAMARRISSIAEAKSPDASKYSRESASSFGVGWGQTNSLFCLAKCAGAISTSQESVGQVDVRLREIGLNLIAA